MLDSATIRRPGMIDGNVDVGRILECMLYYGRVHLVLDGQLFVGLASALGMDKLETLLNHPRVTSELAPAFPAVHSERRGTIQTYKPVFMQVLGQEPKLRQSPAELMLNNLRNIKSLDGVSIQRTVKLLKATRPSNFGEMLGPQKDTDKIFYSLATDPVSLKMALRYEGQKTKSRVDLERLESMTIDAHQFDDGVVIMSNLAPSDVVQREGSEVSWSNILASVHEYMIDSILAQRRSSDVVGTEEISDFAVMRNDLALARADQSREGIRHFEWFAFENVGAFADAYNEGSIDFETALKHIDKSDKFRHWLEGLPPNADIIAEYNAALAREGVFEGTVPSVARFAFFTGAGVVADLALTSGVGTVAGASLALFDNLLVQKVVRGWRPNVFVRNSKQLLKRRGDR